MARVKKSKFKPTPNTQLEHSNSVDVLDKEIKSDDSPDSLAISLDIIPLEISTIADEPNSVHPTSVELSIAKKFAESIIDIHIFRNNDGNFLCATSGIETTRRIAGNDDCLPEVLRLIGEEILSKIARS